MKVSGEIIFISEVVERTTKKDEPSKSFDIVVESSHISDGGKPYKTSVVLSMYKQGDGIKFADQFLEHNKVGNKVEVEFSPKASEWKGKYYNNLSIWRATTISESVSNDSAPVEDDLPF